MDLQDHEEALRTLVEFPRVGGRVLSALGAVQGALAQCHAVNSGPVADFADEALAKVIIEYAPYGSLIHVLALMDSEEFEEEAEEEFEDEFEEEGEE